MTGDILFSQERHLGLITLNRPQALNALNLSMIQSLQQQLQYWADDNSIHAVVVKSTSPKAFCAGGDVRWLYEAGLVNDPIQMEFFWHEYRLNHYLHCFPKPYIPLMDGITMGGGVGITLHGSHPVATERFVFAMPETGIGFFPDIGSSYLLSRCPGETGVYLGLTGNRLDAQKAHTLGLVHSVIAAEHLNAVWEALLHADLSNDAHQRVNLCLQQYSVNSKQTLQRAAIDSCFAQDTIENIISALKTLSNDWALATLDILDKKAPLSLKVTLAQIKKAKLLSMGDCVKMDYCLVNHFMRDADFYEGVRALLVDKDKSPHWQPAHLHQVSTATIADYFENSRTALKLID